ncbi:MAG TPA: biotin--[acetyl-CoA-carboxylase] ligase [Terriglobia bacterium]|nr:biotin--[acetyl-CoA-carboxylase] ligase [Terriglobia bacterium]
MSQPTSRRIDQLIHLLVENATVVMPGPRIAGEIGVTRSTVWMWIEKLRALGLEIHGYPATGYQIRKLPDILMPSLVRAELGDCEIGKKIIHYFLTGSTNTVALKLAAEGAPHGTVVIAEEQSAGRGRFGRSWHSEKSSGIYVSVILRPALAPACAPVLTLMAGLAARRAVENASGLAPDIRWPNDLLLNGRKMGGILTEMNAELDRIHFVVIGIGLNVNHVEMPPDLTSIATSLRIESRRVLSRIHLLAVLLKELQHFYSLLLEGGGAAIASQWETASSFARGKRIRVSRSSGHSFGITQGLEPSGALRVRYDDGREEPLISGEIAEIVK